jgi:sterol desaturase/sphingolipid hydroxylase (fatty acid hydroxylase superfamily)
VINWIIAHRLALSAAFLVLLLAWETVRPFFDSFHGRPAARGAHALRNLAFGGLTVLLLMPVGFVTAWAWAADLSAARGWGALHRLGLPAWAHAAASVVALDCWTYWWHRCNHAVPFLWRFHRAHHSDPWMDVTTATRFHVGEIAMSNVLRIPLILLLGVRVWELALYEILALAVVMFHHANVGLPGRLDRALRVLIVTPAMHKVHHSRVRAETDSNYTALLSVWDRAFGTFRSRADPREIRFGLDGFDGGRDQSVPGMLRAPLARSAPAGAEDRSKNTGMDLPGDDRSVLTRIS